MSREHMATLEGQEETSPGTAAWEAGAQLLKPKQQAITSPSHFTTLPLEIEADLSCPICLRLLVKPCVTECLHRFCHECIQTSLRVGKKECPTCRHPVATRRALRADKSFEGMIAVLYVEMTGSIVSRRG